MHIQLQQIRRLADKCYKITKFPRTYTYYINLVTLVRSFVLVGDLGHERRGATRSSGHVELKPWRVMKLHEIINAFLPI